MGDGVRVRLAVETTVTTTMERRKFVIGAGALATGSAAAMGTGAFTAVGADRNVALEVAGDGDAYLGIESNDTEGYVEQGSDGTVSFDFTGNGEGDGVNNNANTRFERVVTFTNNGTEPIALYLDDGNSSNPDISGEPYWLGVNADFAENVADSSGDVSEGDVSAAVFWNFEDAPEDWDPFGDDSNGTPFATSFDDDSVLSPANADPAMFDDGVVDERPTILTSGESVDLTIQLNTANNNLGEAVEDLVSGSGSIVLASYTEDFISE